jgi:transcriptional regulator with XRE-family HTH domain
VDKAGFRRDRLNAEIDRLVLTNDELARALHVPERSLRRWRRGEATPRRSTVRRIATYFDRDPAWFYEAMSAPEAAA